MTDNHADERGVRGRAPVPADAAFRSSAATGAVSLTDANARYRTPPGS